jgi:hypothetical protein
MGGQFFHDVPTCKLLVCVQEKFESESDIQASHDHGLVESLREFDYRDVDPIKYRPFKKEGHDVTMGKL